MDEVGQSYAIVCINVNYESILTDSNGLGSGLGTAFGDTLRIQVLAEIKDYRETNKL